MDEGTPESESTVDYHTELDGESSCPFASSVRLMVSLFLKLKADFLMTKAFVNTAIRPTINRMTGIRTPIASSSKLLTFFTDESRCLHLKSTQSCTYGLFL